MKYIDRDEQALTVSAGYLWQNNKCLGKIVSINEDFYTIIPG